MRVEFETIAYPRDDAMQIRLLPTNTSPRQRCKGSQRTTVTTCIAALDLSAITIESSLLRRFYAATFLLPLPRRFHEQNLRPNSEQ
jgi:hypothetical protein